MNIIINFSILVNEKNNLRGLMQNFHELQYSNSTISVSGVKDLYEYTDKEIYLGLSEGGLKILGHDLKLTEVDLEKGKVSASGVVGAFNYGGQSKEGFWKKLFK